MLGKIKELQKLLEAAKAQGVSMQRRMRLYLLSMTLAVFAALLLLLSFAGVFSNPAQKLSDSLKLQQKNTVLVLSEQMDALTAQCIVLSEMASKDITDILMENGASFEDLNDNQDLIVQVEEALYGKVYATLCASDCSGTFVLLDATTNTRIQQAENSRMGLWLRYSDINSAGRANQHLVYYRGVSEVARKQQIQMHNRWNLEFDTDYLPGFSEFMSRPLTRLAKGGVWSERTCLKDTWENVMLLYVPILYDDKVRGICGIELSELYFHFSYPSIDSDYGSIVTVLAPIEGDRLFLDRAMLGDSACLQLENKETLSFQEEAYYNIYTDCSRRYIGLHQTLGYHSVSGLELAAVTLIPEMNYLKQAASSRHIWVAGSFIFLLCMLVLVFSLSRRFVKPILQSIQSIQESSEEKQSSGFSEIDELLALIQSKTGGKQIEGGPPDLETFFSDFISRVETLTPMERTVLQYYIEGCEISEVAKRAVISINTAKKHNTNINRKLCITSREELMLYIDLFRRCGRLEQITHNS